MLYQYIIKYPHPLAENKYLNLEYAQSHSNIKTNILDSIQIGVYIKPSLGCKTLDLHD